MIERCDALGAIILTIYHSYFLSSWPSSLFLLRYSHLSGSPTGQAQDNLMIGLHQVTYISSMGKISCFQHPCKCWPASVQQPLSGFSSKERVRHFCPLESLVGGLNFLRHESDTSHLSVNQRKHSPKVYLKSPPQLGDSAQLLLT